jgi:hypothetical protein
MEFGCRALDLGECRGVAQIADSALRDEHHVVRRRKQVPVASKHLADNALDAVSLHGIAHLRRNGDSKARAIGGVWLHEDQEVGRVDASAGDLDLPVFVTLLQAIASRVSLRLPLRACGRGWTMLVRHAGTGLLLLVARHGEPLSSFATAGIQHTPTRFGLHTRAEPVRPKTALTMGLIGPLHSNAPEKRCGNKARRREGVKALDGRREITRFSAIVPGFA